jgi:hypothetical protein
MPKIAAFRNSDGRCSDCLRRKGKRSRSLKIKAGQFLLPANKDSAGGCKDFPGELKKQPKFVLREVFDRFEERYEIVRVV